MTLESMVSDWLHAEAPKRAPSQLLSVTLERVTDIPQDRVLWRRRATTKRRGGYRPLFAIAATLLAMGLLGGLAILGQRPDETPVPTFDRVVNGWVAYASDGNDASGAAIHLVRDGQPDHRIGPSADGLDKRCPAFSADGRRLAYGQAEGSDDSGYSNAVVVIADIDAQGNVSASTTVTVGGTSPPPCVVWSPDGRRLAFSVRLLDSAKRFYQRSGSEVRVVNLDDGNVTVIPDTLASDLEWSPDGTRLAIANGKGPRDPRIALPEVDVLLHSVATGTVESVPGTPDTNWISWSPDGNRIAYERGGWDMVFTDSQNGLESTVGDPGELRDLFVRDLRDGQDQRIATGYKAMHGVGPVWSPNADQIVYQRICEVRPDGLGPCHEEHEVVVVNAGAGSSWRASDVVETVIPYLAIPSGDPNGFRFPFRVTWSPDGESLLYLTWGGKIDAQLGYSKSALIAVPVSSTAAPVVLVASFDLSVYNGDYGVAIQNWGRDPSAEPTPIIPGEPQTPVNPAPPPAQTTPRPVANRPPPSPIIEPIAPGLFSVPRSTWSDFDEPVLSPTEISADFQMPARWLTNGSGRLFKARHDAPAGIGLQIGTVAGVYTDPCHWSSGMADLPEVPLGERHDYEGMADALAHSQVTPESGLLAGFDSWELTLDTPEDLSGCDYGEFRRWEAPAGHSRFDHRPGQIDRIWLIAAGGEMVVIHGWYFPDTPAADRAELLGIVRSLWFTPHWD